MTLAPNRTYRKNPLNGLNYYTGGWNPSSKDYWAVRVSRKNDEICNFCNPHSSQNRTHRKDPLDGLKFYTGGAGTPAARTTGRYVFRERMSNPLRHVIGVRYVVRGLCTAAGIALGHPGPRDSRILPPHPALRLYLFPPLATPRHPPLSPVRHVVRGSVMWSVVYAPLLGLLWLILGLGILGFSLLTCLCCRDKWSQMRDPAYAKYTKKDLWVPLGFMLLGIVTVLVGFSVMLAGGVQLRNRVNTVTDYITETVDFTTAVIFNMTSIVQLTSTINITNTVVPPDKKADIQSKAVVANQTATDLQAKTENGITIINNALRVVTLTFSIIGCVITALCILALIFSLLKWAVVSNVTVTIIWVVVFFTWCTTAGLIIAYLVNGDTSVALEQVEQDPTVNSAMDTYLHCIPSDQLLNATRYARYTASTALTTANTSVATNAPQAFDLVNATGGICVPYGPPPDYTRNMSYCGANTVTFQQLVDELAAAANSSTAVPVAELAAAANSSTAVPVAVQNNLTAAARPPLRKHSPLSLIPPVPVPPLHALPFLLTFPPPQELAAAANSSTAVPVAVQNDLTAALPLSAIPPSLGCSLELAAAANSSTAVPVAVQNDLTAAAKTLSLLESTIPNVLILCGAVLCGSDSWGFYGKESTIPNVLLLVNCSYVANIATARGREDVLPSRLKTHLLLCRRYRQGKASPMLPCSPLGGCNGLLLCARAPVLPSVCPSPPLDLLPPLPLLPPAFSPSSPSSPSSPLSPRLPVKAPTVCIDEAQEMVVDFHMLWFALNEAQEMVVDLHRLWVGFLVLLVTFRFASPLISLLSLSFQFALDEAQAMVTDFQMLWIGFLVITIACMMQALSMPIYVFRAVRLGDKLGDTETEGLYKAAAVPVAYPAEGEGYDGQTQGNEPSFAEGTSNSYEWDAEMYALVTSYRFHFLLFFIANVLEQLNILNRAFQHKELDYASVHAQIKRTTSHIESRYIDCGDDFGGGVSELLSPFITRPGPGGDKEVTVKGVDLDGRPARFTFRLHEDEQEEFDGPGTHDGFIEVCTEFAEVIVHQLLHRLGDLEGMSGAKLFTPDEYPLDRGERNRRCMEWLESLVTLFKADLTEEILPGKPMSYKKRKPHSNAPLPPAGKQQSKKGTEVDEVMEVVDLDDENDALDSDEDDGFDE
ncbi:unnamed protein product [Closterium sp. Naga37s-1]|nr:unnamed protein product [Closterium sp. Naga37s-1]